MKNAIKNETFTAKEHLEEAATQLLNEGKKRVNDLYEEGMSKKNELEDHLKEYSDRLLQKVQENPLASVCIAAGIGFLVSKIMKK